MLSVTRVAELQFLSLLGGVAWQEMKKWNEGAGGARRHVPQLYTPRLSWKYNCTPSHTPPQCQRDTNLYLAGGHDNGHLESLEGTFTMLCWTLTCVIPMISSDIAARVSLLCQRFSPMDQAWKDVSIGFHKMLAFVNSNILFLVAPSPLSVCKRFSFCDFIYDLLKIKCYNIAQQTPGHHHEKGFRPLYKYSTISKSSSRLKPLLSQKS